MRTKKFSFVKFIRGALSSLAQKSSFLSPICIEKDFSLQTQVKFFI